MSAHPPSPRSLSDSALDSFDVEFRDWQPYLRFLRTHLADQPQWLLDVGGGNGRFVDGLLHAFPLARGVLIDLAQSMVARNRSHPRKTALIGDANSFPEEVVRHRYDLITLNVLLHHLVGDNDNDTRHNVLRCINKLRLLLSAHGRLIVYEQVYDRWFEAGPEPGAIVYGLTRLRNPLVVPVLRRMGANTAGVGVRFRSRTEWRRLFTSAGYDICTDAPITVDRTSLLHRFTLNLGYWGTHVFLLRNGT